ncbi:MAG: response regulator, partial [Planctomycetota bacterium]
RVVRDAAKAEDKIVGLELIGEDAGIERSLQQRLYEPLLHIVRNCVCHGIEAPVERQRVGKSESGTISIEARSAADLCVIEIRDDGRGLDYDAIRRRGIQRGLIPADAAVTRQELSQLIFEPGFSTRQQADAIAGRGVGMDVVATTLNRMRGWLEVDSEPGKGTRIRLSFPLPSVIQHVMVFRSNEQLFAIPMPSVQAAGDLRPESRCVDFAAMLDDTPEDVSRYDAGVLLSSDLCSHTDLGTTQITLLVDQVVGPEEVVLRPLPAMLRSHPFCTAASLSGMGETVLILDARRLIQAKRERFQAWRTALPAVTAKPSEKAQRPTILVVDDSLSARRRVVRSLSRYPVEIVEAGDGRQALDLMKQQQFSAVLSDMEMPHVTGMELLAEVRAGRQAAETPFVIISSRQEPEYTDRARQLGVTDYLPKPLADDDLDAVLRQESVRKHLSLPSQSWTPGAIR